MSFIILIFSLHISIIILPKLIKSKFINHVKEIYIEWHERFWHGTHEYQNKINQRRDIIATFDNYDTNYAKR